MAINYIDTLAFAIRNELDETFRPKDHAEELYRIYALLVLVKGPAVTLEDVHNAWSVWTCRIDPGHGALVPFKELDEKKREQDRPYAEAIWRVASAMRRQ